MFVGIGCVEKRKSWGNDGTGGFVLFCFCFLFTGRGGEKKMVSY